MVSKSIENHAQRILEEMNIKRPAVNVDKIAKERGLKVIPYELGDDVSGVLYVDKGKGTIGYNPNESEVRRRFTIAHELGHYELHRLNKEIFVDNGKKQFNALFRDHRSSKGEDIIEQEANAFAAALLMPRNLLIKEIEKRDIDLSSDDDDVIRDLAQKFQVSVQAMTIRIGNLFNRWI